MMEFKQKKPGCLLSIILIFIAIIGFTIVQGLTSTISYLILTWPVWLGKMLEYCIEFSKKSTFNKIVITFSFTLIGVIFYKIRKEALMIFGILEFSGGVCIIWATLVSPSLYNLTNGVAIGSGLFLIVTGIENYLKGFAIEEDKKFKQ